MNLFNPTRSLTRATLLASTPVSHCPAAHPRRSRLWRQLRFRSESRSPKKTISYQFAFACLGLMLWAAAHPASAQSPEIEYNGVPAEATPLVLTPVPVTPGAPAGTFIAAMRGTIADPGDVDCYSFASPPIGGTAWLYVRTGGDSVLRLLGPGGATVEVDDDDGTGNAYSAVVESIAASVMGGVPLAPGATFTIEISQGAGGAVGDYELFAAIRPVPPLPDPPLPLEVEFNGTVPLALGFPPLLPAFTNEPAFGVVNGMIAGPPLSDLPDLFLVPAMSGDVLQVTLDCNPGRLGSENLSVSLLDEFGVPLFTAENSGPPFADLAVPPDPSAEGFCWEITAPGPYFLSVAGPPGADYTLAVQRQTRGVLSLGSATLCVEEGAGAATVAVTRTGGSFGEVTVSYTTTNGTAQAGVDYAAVSGTLVFGPGEISQTFTVPILDDTQSEAGELAGVYLSNVTNGPGLGLSFAQVGIADNDEPDNSSAATAIPLDLTAGIAISRGAISPGGDVDYYRLTNPVVSGRLVALVATGAPQFPCSSSRTPRLSLYAADGMTLREVDAGDGFDPGGAGPGTADSAAIVRTMNTIGVYYLRLEADTPGAIIDPYVLHVALNPNAAGNEVEPNGTFATPHFIDLGPWPLATVRGFFDSAMDTDTYLLTALAGSELLVGVDGDPERDGVSTDVVVELIAGDQTTVLVRANSSALPTTAANPFLSEAFCWSVPTAAAETHYLRMTGTPGGAYRLTVAARSAGQIHFDNLTRYPCGPLYYTTESAGSMNVTVLRTYGNFGPASVSVATQDGSAVAGLDYSAVATTVNFAHGETRKTIAIPILNDTARERVENLDLLLGNPTGGATAWQFALAACVSGTVSPESPASRLFIVDDDEPANDFYTNAPALDASFTVASAHGTVSPWTGDMVDWYCITNPEPNSELWITVDTGGPRPYSPYLSRDSIVAVYRADGSYLASDDDHGSGNGGDSTLESDLASALAGVRLPTVGNYYVAVFAFDPSLGIMKSEPANTNVLPIVDYSLKLTLTHNAALPSFSRSDSLPYATPIVTACMPAGARTNSLRYGEERWYSVVASAGDELHVSLDGNISRRPTGCTLADSIVDLIAPDGGTVLFSANSSGCGGSEGFGYVATSSGTFFVRVRLSSRNEGYTTPMGIKLMVARQSPFSVAVQMAGPDVRVSFPTSAGQIYTVQGSDDLVTWTTLPGAGAILGTGGPAVYVDTGSAGRPARYYRIVASGDGAMGAAVPLCLAPPTGLIAWWAGDGNASSLVGGLEGTLEGGASFTNGGYVGSAFHFDGVNDFIRLGDVLDPGSASFTVNTWFRRTGTATDFRLFSKIRSEGYWLGGDGGDIVFEANGGPRVRVTAPLPALNEWHHVAGVLDRAGREVRLYLDGALYARQAFTTLGDVTTENYLSLGARDRGPGPGTADSFFPGQMDEAQYFNRALSDCEVAAIFEAGRAGQCQP
jgi:hypothetical protein